MKKKFIQAAMLFSIGVFTLTGCGRQESGETGENGQNIQDARELVNTEAPEQQDIEAVPEEQDAETESDQESPQAQSADATNPSDTQHSTEDNGNATKINEDETGNAALDSYTDSDQIFNSAAVTGIADTVSDSGCTLLAAETVSEDTIVLPAKGSADAKDVAIPVTNIIYTDDIEFVLGSFKSTGGSFSLDKGSKSDVNAESYLLVYGNVQEDGSYLADKIIIASFT